ncbi:MAG: hypothetical protein G01um101433_1050 [Parcubacteria group bacterium Gr01-1014_33]|nr:MAG: hypothetical protein G01um101433_1050 [Parcubacteria group bacterium Gr01-1014_33]
MDKRTSKKIRVYYDKKGNTLNVWFDDPKKEYISEETGEEVIIVKDKHGKVIGFEKLNYFPAPFPRIKTLPVEVVVS